MAQWQARQTLIRAAIDTETNETSPIFQDLTANFGPKFPHHGLSGRLVYAKPSDACGPVQPAPGPREDNIGWVLIVARGGHCGFADKVLAAQQRGYDAVIVHNYEGHESLVKMYGNENGSFIHIPSTFVGWQEGMRLKNEYNYTYKKYYVKVIEADDINYKLYLWPFAIVVAVCFVLVMVFVVIKFVREHASRRLNRLSKKHLKKIPVRKFKKGDYYDTCAICLDEYEEGEKIRVLPCDHVYHTKCIDPWLTKNKKTCPICKRRVIPGRDADDTDSENEGDGGNNTNSSERTPLLQESNSSGASGAGPAGRSAPQYTSSTTTPSLHTPGNAAGSPPSSLSHCPPPPLLSSSQQSASAHISNDGCGQVVMSQGHQGRSVNSTLPTDSEGAQGAVGGEGISDQFATTSSVEAVVLRGEPGSRRKRRPEFRRAGIWQQDDGPIEFTVHGTRNEPETREERRERRRRKKEKKRRAEELARQTVMDEAHEAEEDALLHEVAVEVGTSEDPDTPAVLAVEVLPGIAGSIQATPDVEIQGRKKEDEEEGYINPSYSESEEVVLQNRGRRHEMNDMV
ncbi:E3 ubiquitin-protein ligase RNF13 [Elysia marginata]|uniref:RING-type E3 ubiquitin transferase n=1 Tax=Elysia marginata TaxID=1093978 RepID=A0AAV4EIR6_9GAST|nr:E3 ubiquitin-protein ligase RNF13 [Elysia marginata]